MSKVKQNFSIDKENHSYIEELTGVFGWPDKMSPVLNRIVTEHRKKSTKLQLMANARQVFHKVDNTDYPDKDVIHDHKHLIFNYDGDLEITVSYGATWDNGEEETGSPSGWIYKNFKIETIVWWTVMGPEEIEIDKHKEEELLQRLDLTV